MSQGISVGTIEIAKRAVIMLPLLTSPASAEDFTAEYVMRDFDQTELSAFVVGVIEGLAQGRYERDGNDPAGAKCIYDWYYEDGEKAISDIQINFIAHKSAAPAAVISAMVNRECGT